MNGERIEELLLRLIQDMSEVKAKLNAIEQQELGQRIDRLEAECREHAKAINSLEHRNDEMEKFVRDSMKDSRKQTTGVFISIGVAIFSAFLSVVTKMF